MKSLADILGVADPDAPEKPVAAYEFKTAEAFAKEILHSPEYRLSLFQRIRSNTLAPVVERSLYEYAWGKPVSRIEVKDVTDLSNYTMEQLAQRAAQLQEMAKALDAEEATMPRSNSIN